MTVGDRDRLCRRIVATTFRLNTLLLREGNRLADRAGVTQQQWVVLSALDRAGGTGLPLSALGRDLLVTKANVTGLIDRLERSGLVRRGADGADRRIVRAHLTGAGRTLLRRLAPSQVAWGRRTYADLDDRTLTTLDAVLEQHKETLLKASRRTA